MAVLLHSESLPSTTTRDWLRDHEGNNGITWSFCFSCHFFSPPPPPPSVSLSLFPASTSNSIITAWRWGELLLWGPASLNSTKEKERSWEFIAIPSPPLLPVIPSRNRREEERAAPGAQRCYNNREKEGLWKWLVCICICVCGQLTSYTHG